MTENSWWSTKIKKVWHQPLKSWVANKRQDLVNKGLPDIDACWSGVAVKVELKYAPAFKARQDTKYTFSHYSKDQRNRMTIVSREQYRNLEEWATAGGLAFILIGIKDYWYLLELKDLINDGMTEIELMTQSTMHGGIKQVDMVPSYFEDTYTLHRR